MVHSEQSRQSAAEEAEMQVEGLPEPGGAAIDHSGRSFLFVLASSRKDGNTETLARLAARHLPPDIPQRWLALSDYPLPAFADVRHRGEEFPPPGVNERALLEATLSATDLVIASPLYWYTVSASAKLYLDYWSAWLRLRDVDFKGRMTGKTIWSVSALAEEDSSVADPLIHTLRLTARYLDAHWGGSLLGNGSWPGDVLKDGEALARARAFFAPVAAVV